MKSLPCRILACLGVGLLSLGCAVAQERPPMPEPTYAEVKYGPHERNVLDFWKAPGDGPRPLIVHIHGGGFVGGDKRGFSPVFLQAARDAGISMAAIHYRFVGNGTIFPAPQQDGARAIQFLRSKASEWNIDPKQIGRAHV